MIKAKKTILLIISFAIFLIIALLIQKTIILKSLSIDNVGVAENQITFAPLKSKRLLKG